MTLRASPLLLDLARAALRAGSPVPCVRPVGRYRFVGPLARPYEWLCLMVFDGPNGFRHLCADGPRGTAPTPEGFVAVADVTADLGVVCLLVERAPD